MNPTQLYARLVLQLAEWTGYPPQATDAILHIHAGMAILLIARIASRRSLATPWPLLTVYLAELANELMDYVSNARIMPDTYSDIAHTVFWPTVLFLGLRYRRPRPGAGL